MLQLTLDMEMPQECHECQFQLKFKNGEADSWYSRRCVIEQRIIEYPKPQWCPLRDARIVEKSENENKKEVLEEIKNGKV